MASYRLSPSAAVDLERLWFYGLERWGVEAADRYYDALIAHFEDLSEQPKLYPLTDIRQGYRRSLCGSDSVFYRINDDVVEIMAIIGRQDAGTWV